VLPSSAQTRDFYRPDPRPQCPAEPQGWAQQMATTTEKRAKDVAGAGGGADHRTPRPPKDGTEWRDLARRRQAGWLPAPPRCPAACVDSHHRVSQQPPPENHRPVRAQMGRAGLKLQAAGAGAPPP
jgi:hypothetical protein